MDEKVIANLVFFFLLPSPALTIPFPVNKLPNKLAPKVPKSILKNPPLCSLISFSIVLLTPFNKISEFFSSYNILYLLLQ